MTGVIGVTGTVLAPAVLVMSMLCIMAARVAGPFGQHAAGAVLAEYRLGPRERLLLHRRSLYALGIVLLAGAATGVIPRGIEVVGIAGAFAVVLGLPAAYRLTEDGIGFNAVVFRAWSDFVTLEERRAGLRLVGRPGAGDFSVVCLAGERRDGLRRVAGARLRATAIAQPALRRRGGNGGNGAPQEGVARAHARGRGAARGATGGAAGAPTR